MNRKYFEDGGIYNEQFEDHPGMKYLCKMLNNIDERQDLWIVFEVCGKPMSKQLFEVKGEFFKGERIYSVMHRKHVFEMLE
jgi:hypothetical protein